MLELLARGAPEADGRGRGEGPAEADVRIMLFVCRPMTVIPSLRPGHDLVPTYFRIGSDLVSTWCRFEPIWFQLGPVSFQIHFIVQSSSSASAPFCSHFVSLRQAPVPHLAPIPVPFERSWLNSVVS